MSTIRYFDSIPHIVRYGMRDEKKGRSWTLFYRNAVCFKVSVAKEDVAGTPFETKWSEYLEEKHRPDWVERWNEMCDLIITHCMPVLRELAPTGRQWRTLEDHLRTPAYEVKLVRQEQAAAAAAAGGDSDAAVVAQVTSGPTVRTSYEHHLSPFSEVDGLPEDVRQCRADELTVLDADKNWRSPPYKVRTPDGEVFYFVACNRSSTNVGTGEVTNRSLEKIGAYSRLYRHTGSAESKNVNIPKLQGIVVSDADTSRMQSGDAAAAPTETPNLSSTDVQKQGKEQNIQTQGEEPNGQPMLAGILLTYVSKAKYWADVKKLFADESPEQVKKWAEKWREQITAAVQHLHDHGLAVGGRTGDNPWPFINQYTVYIAPVHSGETESGEDRARLGDADAWLMLSAGCTGNTRHERGTGQGEGQEGADEEFEKQKAMDWEAVEKLFQF